MRLKPVRKSGHFTGLSRAYIKRDALARLAHAYHSARGEAICADFRERVLWVEIHHSANLSRATTTDWILAWMNSVFTSCRIWRGFSLARLPYFIPTLNCCLDVTDVTSKWCFMEMIEKSPFMFRKRRARGHLSTYRYILP